MSLLGQKAKALVRCNRKKFEAANQLSLSKWWKGNEEALLHSLAEDPYQVIPANELPSERSLNQRKHNGVVFLGRGTDGQLMYQQARLPTQQAPQSSVDTSFQPDTDSFFNFDYRFDVMDYHVPQDPHPILHPQESQHLIKD
jgi:hypothetical protein